MPIRSLLALLAVCAILAAAMNATESAVAPASEAEALTNDERFLQLASICVRKADVFAVHKLGVYRADRATKRWRRLALPPGMPLHGSFARPTDDAPAVCYLAAWSNWFRPKDVTGYGVYLSLDDGRTWRHLAGTESASAVCWHRGRLYIGAREKCEGMEWAVLRVSDDLGKSWQDISLGNEGDYASIQSVMPDPDHERLVSVELYTGIRSVWLQAEDERYRWKWHHGFGWKGQGYQYDMFEPRYFSSTIGYFFAATLENYFRYPFGENVGRCPFRITPERRKFVFRAGDPAIVPFTLRFEDDLRVSQAWWRTHPEDARKVPYPTEPIMMKIRDDAAGGVWGLNVEFAGEKTAVSPAVSKMRRETRDQDALSRQLREDATYRFYPLSAMEPYRRSLDLAKFYDFSRPGTYRVQLVFDSSPFAANYIGDNRGAWCGGFNGDEFIVTIVAP